MVPGCDVAAVVVCLSVVPATGCEGETLPRPRPE